METNSLPIELDPYHFNTYDGKNSFCLHTRENKPCFWNSCQDIQTKTPLIKPARENKKALITRSKKNKPK